MLPKKNCRVSPRYVLRSAKETMGVSERESKVLAAKLASLPGEVARSQCRDRTSPTSTPRARRPPLHSTRQLDLKLLVSGREFRCPDNWIRCGTRMILSAHHWVRRGTPGASVLPFAVAGCRLSSSFAPFRPLSLKQLRLQHAPYSQPIS
ncbi:hypothetical protein LZ31DRAFT_22425 [Colletotrichum somersetense]|nr:hypothetical protein LZ31DRAFT_22425 [Colletotrichum somersetense]